MQITNSSIQEFIDTLEPNRQEEINQLIAIGKKLTNKEPVLWGSIVGFGHLHYQYESGHSGEMPLFSFASRKNAWTLYLSFDIQQFSKLAFLGKHTIGKGCLYIKKLADVDVEVLESLIKEAMEVIKAYPFIQIIS
jgi:hypothetical protein